MEQQTGKAQDTTDVLAGVHTVQDVADRARISPQRVGQLIKARLEGDLRPGYGIAATWKNGHYWITEADVVEYLTHRPPRVHAGPGRGHKKNNGRQ